MSFRTSSHAASVGQPGMSSASTSQATLLQQRIHEKRLELENLRQLRDLSAGLAGQMEQLQEKMSTLSDGTEAIAAVMSNWHNVLRAISMASAGIPAPNTAPVEHRALLPQTLIRIPVQDLRPSTAADDRSTDHRMV